MSNNLKKRNDRLTAELKKMRPTIDTSGILLLFSTDLSLDAEPCRGFTVVREKTLSVYNEKDGDAEYSLSEISEFNCTVGFGCLSLDCKINGKDRILCRSTMAKLHEISLICKQMNRHLGGRSVSLKEAKDIESVCPKCGRPYENKANICMHCIDKKANLQRLVSAAKPDLPKIALATVMLLLSAALNLLIPKINAVMVDDYIKSPNPGAITWQSFLFVILALAGANAASSVIGIIRSVSTTSAGVNIAMRLRKTVFEKIESLSFGRVSKKQTGELMERVNRDTQEIRQVLTGMIPELFYQFTVLISVSVIIIRFDWRLALLIFIPIPFVLAGFYLFWNSTRQNFSRQWSKSMQTSTVLHDIFNGIRVVKSFGMEKNEAKRYDKCAADFRDITKKNDVFFSVISPILNFAIGIGEFFLLYYAGNKILAGEMTLGVMTQFSTYISLIYGRMRWFSNIPRRMVQFITSLSKINELLSEEPDIVDTAKKEEKKIEGHISFEHICFGYEDSADVLRDINFEIHPGEMIGIVGKSGTGKTTLINLLMRLYDVDDGAIKIDGTDIRDIPQEELRRNIGVVLQENYLFRGTIFDNIAYAKPNATHDEVIAAAKVSGAHSFIMKLPDGYNTYIGEHGQTLSGGEKQRISIARAMLHDPKILILDEATASLDTETEKTIQDALERLIKQRTTIAIAHRLSTLRNADRLVVIDRGRVAEIGTHEELLKKKGIYFGLVMAQRQMSKMNTGKEENNA